MRTQVGDDSVSPIAAAVPISGTHECVDHPFTISSLFSCWSFFWRFQVIEDGLCSFPLPTLQAHWNVTGPHFIGLHELFDQIDETVESYVDPTWI